MLRDADQSGCIAVVGATGAVGREALAILHERGVERTRVRALASERSVGTTVAFGSHRIDIELLEADAFEGVTLAIFAAGADVARRFAPEALRRGATVIDNSSAFRADPDVPLAVPEVNGGSIAGHRLIANPNCTTIILLAAIEPLRRAFGVEAIDVATYQAVSGAGAAGIDELLEQTRAAFGGRGGFDRAEGRVRDTVFGEPCAFNVFSHDSAVDPTTGVNGEERKVIDETRRIWGQPEVRVTPTCVRVPVVRAHTEAITVTLAEAATEQEVRDALAAGEGLTIVDDREANAFPTPRNATGRDDILVGRLRPDPGTPLDGDGRSTRWCLLVCGDQLRKGAALNAIQIAERTGSLPTEQPSLAVSGPDLG